MWKNIYNSKMQKNLSVYLLNALQFFVFIFIFQKSNCTYIVKDTKKNFPQFSEKCPHGACNTSQLSKICPKLSSKNENWS